MRNLSIVVRYTCCGKIETKYYSSDEPIKMKKKKKDKKQNKNYQLVRFLTLEFAPEEYLINNKFKLV